MSVINRTWLAFTAIGTALIHLALVVGSPLPFGILFALLGVAELGFGILVLIRERVPAPRLVLAIALTPIVAWGLAVTAAIVLGNTAIASPLPVLPLGAAAALEIIAAAVVAWHLRMTAGYHAPRTAPSAVRYLGAVLGAGIAVSMLTTPALAATEAGRSAVPHGEHGMHSVVEDAAPTTIRLPSHSGHSGR